MEDNASLGLPGLYVCPPGVGTCRYNNVPFAVNFMKARHNVKVLKGGLDRGRGSAIKSADVSNNRNIPTRVESLFIRSHLFFCRKW